MVVQERVGIDMAGAQGEDSQQPSLLTRQICQWQQAASSPQSGMVTSPLGKAAKVLSGTRKFPSRSEGLAANQALMETD